MSGFHFIVLTLLLFGEWLSKGGSKGVEVRPNKKISVFLIKCLKILGRHTYIFLINFFLEKNKVLCILKGISSFKMHKLIFFQKT